MPTRAQLLQDRSLRSRAALVDAATALWSERPVAEVKVAEICAAAGTSKGLFYFYFDSREALAAHLLADDADQVASAVETLVAEGPLPARTVLDDLLRVAVTTLGRRVQRRPRHVLVAGVPAWIAAGLAEHDPLDLHVPLSRTFGRVVQVAADRRQVRGDVDPHEAGLLLADASMLAVHEWAASPRRQPSLARRLSARTDLIRHGLGR